LDIQIVLTFAVYNLIRKYHLGDVLMTGLTGEWSVRQADFSAHRIEEINLFCENASAIRAVNETTDECRREIRPCSSWPRDRRVDNLYIRESGIDLCL